MKLKLTFIALFISVISYAQVVVTSSASFATALANAETQNITSINLNGLTVQGNFVFPKALGSSTGMIEIYNGTIDGSLKRLLPTSQSEAVDGSSNWYRFSANIHDIQFKGSSGVGLQLNCMYSAIVHNNMFRGLDTGYVGIFMLNNDISNNRFTGCKSSSLVMRSGVGYWAGAGLSTSASNNPRLIGNRIFNATGASTGISLIACSGINIEDHISEGGTPNYHIFIDGLNNTTSWFRNLERIHIESRATITSIYIAERQGFVHLADLFFQYPSNMLEVASQAGAITVVWDRIAYIPTASTIKSTGNTVRWQFNSVYPNINVTNTTLWVGGNLPAVLNFNKLDGTGKVEETWVNGVKK
jgi:hypothetical protein